MAKKKSLNKSKTASKKASLRIVYKDAKGKIGPASKAKHAWVYRQGKLLKKISFAKVKESVSNKEKAVKRIASSLKQITKVKPSRLATEATKRSKTPKRGSAKLSPVARPIKKKPRKPPERGVAAQRKAVSSPLPTKKARKKPQVSPPTRKTLKSKALAPVEPKRYKLDELLNIEKLDHSRRKIRRGKFHGVVGAVTITPYVPETHGYKKTLVLKKVKPINQNRLLSLAILDYELKSPVAITRQNIKGAIAFIKRNFYPHMKRFFARFGSKAYLFRLVIERQDLRFGKVSHGVGERRMETISFKSLEEFWDKRLLNASTFMKFSKLNYFSQSVDGVIWLKGFTLEVVKKEEEYLG